MSCTNCFNGCSEIVSDKCVKYTGVAIPALGIQTGDTLEFVEQTLASFLITTLDGTGIKPIIDLQGVCSLFTNNIPVCVSCTGPTLNDLLQALIVTACDLESLIINVSDNLEVLESPYTTDCVTVVNTTTSITHNVLQAVILKLCELDESLTVVINSLENFVTLTGPNNINDIVITILEEQGLIGNTTKQYNKMIPFSVIEYYGPLSGYPTISDGFNGSGVGYGAWEKIYLCNGDNNTPDKRGRVGIGATNTPSTLPLPVTTDPNIIGNPTYTFGGTLYGENTITLQRTQIPLHTHANTAESVDSGHTHNILDAAVFAGLTVAGGGSGQYFQYGTMTTESASAVIETTMTNVAGPSDGGQSHSNVQPGLACYYIQYRP